MRSYYKYTDGGVFTLSGNDYKGFFNITNNEAYTGRSLSNLSLKLDSSNTFLAKTYLSQLEFDQTTAQSSLKQQLTSLDYSPNNILNVQTLKRNLDILNKNNILLYTLSVSKSPLIADLLNTEKDKDAGFFGLSSTTLDTRNDDFILYKDFSTDYQIDPFSYADTNRFPNLNILDDIISSYITLNEDKTFLYYVTTSTDSYILSGSFTKNGSLVSIDTDSLQQGSTLFVDNNKEILYAVNKTNGLYNISLYDNSFLKNCGSFLLKDKITLPITDIIDNTIKIVGDKIVYLKFTNNSDTNLLEVLDLTSLETLKSVEVSTSVAYDIRDVDGLIAILETTTPFTTYNLYLLEDDYTSNVLPEPIVINRRISSLKYDVESKLDIIFSKADSNIFYIRDTNTFSLRYISQPYEVGAVFNEENLLLPPPLLFSTLDAKFDDNKYKFDTNKLPSNNLNIKNILFTNNSVDSYIFIHAIGRLYFIPPKDIDDGSKRLKSFYNGTIHSCNSTIGINTNMHLQNIVRDTLNIYTNISKIPTPGIINGISVLSNYKTIPEISINLQDFYVHSNESVNYIVIDRVFNKIFNLQQTIYNTFTTV